MCCLDIQGFTIKGQKYANVSNAAYFFAFPWSRNEERGKRFHKAHTVGRVWSHHMPSFILSAAPRGAEDLGVTGEGFDHKSEVAVRLKFICQEVESPDWDGLRGIVWNVSCSLKVSLTHFHALLFVLRYVSVCNTNSSIFLSSTFCFK